MSMSSPQPATTVVNTVQVRKDIFDIPNLDIYTQMTYIVLSMYTSSNSQSLPTVNELARKGRMNNKQVTHSLQTLVELKMLSHKIFREIIGDFGDDRLSWAAKGLLAYYKNNPNVELNQLYELSGQSKDDEQSIRAAIQELKRFGYIDEHASISKAANGSTFDKRPLSTFTIPVTTSEVKK
jgi:hypothetical protein